MGITTEFDKANNIRIHKVTETPNKEQGLRMLAKIYSSSDFEPDMNALWDFSYADLSLISLDDPAELAHFISKNTPPSSNVKTAIVASEALTKYLVNLVIKELFNSPVPDVKIFDKKEDALLWLK